jgi:hypothetical protein
MVVWIGRLPYVSGALQVSNLAVVLQNVPPKKTQRTMITAALNRVMATKTALCAIHFAAFFALPSPSSEPLSDLGRSGVRSLPLSFSSCGFEGEEPISRSN